MTSNRRRILLASVLAVVAPLTGLAVWARAGTQPAPPSAAPVLAAGHAYTVTLVTGEVVTVRTGTARCPQVSVRARARGDVVSKQCGPDGHVRVVPAQAAGLLEHPLDPALFDVTTLIQQGYDDAHSPDVPLIVRYGRTGAAADPGTDLQGTRALPSLGAVAGRQPKRQPLRLQPSRPGAAPLAGVAHMWLDRRVHASALTELPDSGVAADLRQIGAPQAWQDGVTGRGQRVAVLDTGIDATHPDLAGKVVASADFTGGGDPVDRAGHGTHVAATIAGTGAASHGVHRGVAPDAQLVVGKVLGDDGTGTDSQVIAGMQWAAPLAGIVNLSLGGDPSDGSDPLSQALDSLSAQYGTLFVVAAGNAGPGPGTVSAPASASSALAVGAVDSTDRLAGFSSRGPVTGTHAFKPEIVAPGVDIVSARAAGTGIGTVVDRYYTTLSGTSMATPHVAGAAALVRQRHPDWTGEHIKAALVGGTATVHSGDSYEHGAGRVDLPAALSTVVSAVPVAGTDSDTAGWANTGTSPVTLGLELRVTDRNGRPVPPGSVTLSASTVRVPAGGTASVTVTVDRARLAGHPDEYEGVLTARADGRAVRTPVAFTVEPPMADLTVRTTALPGTPDGAGFWDALVSNVDNPDAGTFQFLDGAVGTDVTIQVPAGRYSVLGDVFDTTTGATRDALAGTAEVRVSGPTTVLLDGAGAHRITARVSTVDGQAQQVGIAAVQGGRFGGPFEWIEPSAFGADAARWPVYTTAVGRVDVGFLHTAEAFSLVSATGQPSPFVYELLRTLPDSVPADPSYVVGARDRDRLARVDEHFDQLDLPGTRTGHNRKGLQQDDFFVFEDQTDVVPADRVDYLTPGVLWTEEPVLTGDSPLAAFLLMSQPLRGYPPGSRQADESFRQPLRPDWYDDAAGPVGCSPAPIARTRGNLHIELAALVDRHQRFNCLSSFWPGTPPALTLERDGRPIGSASGFVADFAIPAGPGTYRLTDDQDDTGVLPFSTKVRTAWTFRSSAPTGDGTAPVPLFSLDYALPLDSANHPVAGTGTVTVRQSHGVPAQRVTALSVWTSTDDGVTWQPAPVRPGADGFVVALPVPASGQAVSLRVNATGDGGSGIDQTIVRAYRAP